MRSHDMESGSRLLLLLPVLPSPSFQEGARIQRAATDTNLRGSAELDFHLLQPRVAPSELIEIETSGSCVRVAWDCRAAKAQVCRIQANIAEPGDLTFVQGNGGAALGGNARRFSPSDRLRSEGRLRQVGDYFGGGVRSDSGIDDVQRH